ncbi:hypothetical protein SMD44_p10090 (plasmid) [Streptomyces alboflavus]|uniref:Uncharacterized protein n=1 Tax=Streptomyces alboflavus TaxID=67267 RepID=A0A291W4T0_9ACTN|nr:hypothetical protein [Streptomyces alboflavus]ATM24589.1 hypothetical protein SMD44_p10090 [Streptomyces alboflavus]
MALSPWGRPRPGRGAGGGEQRAELGEPSGGGDRQLFAVEFGAAHQRGGQGLVAGECGKVPVAQAAQHPQVEQNPLVAQPDQRALCAGELVHLGL